MADGRHIENRFLAIYQRHIGQFMQVSEQRWRITFRYQLLDQNGNFRKFKWRTAAILKIALSLYLSRELSDFHQIWYAYANFHSEDGHLTKIEIFQIQDGGLTPYWSFVFWLYLGAILADQCEIWRWMITCRCITSDQNCNFRKFKMANGRHFENSFISISQPWIIRFRSNLVHI